MLNCLTLNNSKSFGNDNIRTSHLKCDRCRTRVILKGIEQSDGIETRSFGCVHCGASKTIQIATSETLPEWMQSAAQADCSSH